MHSGSLLFKNSYLNTDYKNNFIEKNDFTGIKDVFSYSYNNKKYKFCEKGRAQSGGSPLANILGIPGEISGYYTLYIEVLSYPNDYNFGNSIASITFRAYSEIKVYTAYIMYDCYNEIELKSDWTNISMN